METATTTEPREGAEPTGEPQEELASTPGKLTRYMVIWSRVPKEEDHEYRWLEIGWYEAHSQGGARKAAGRDEDSGMHGRIVDAAKQGPIVLRAIPQSSWPEDVEPSGVETTATLVIR